MKTSFLLPLLLLFSITVQAQTDPAQAERDRADKYTAAEDFPEAQKALRAAVDIYQKTPSENKKEQIRALQLMSYTVSVTGDFEVFRSESLESFNLVREAIPDSSSVLAEYSLMAGAGAYYTRRINEAIELFELTKNYAEQSGNISKSGVITNNLASCYSSKGDFRSALAGFQESLAFFQSKGKESHAFNIYTNIGNCLLDMGDPSAASTYFYKSLQSMEEYRNEIDAADFIAKKATAELNLSECLTTLGRYPTALAHAEAALKIRLNGSGENHPDLVPVYTQLADINVLMKNYETAENYLAVAARTAEINKIPRNSASVSLGLAELLFAAGKNEQALEQARKSADYSVESKLPNRRAKALLQESKILAADNHLTESRAVLDTVLQIYQYRPEQKPAETEEIYDVIIALGTDAIYAFKQAKAENTPSALQASADFFDEWLQFTDYYTANTYEETGQNLLADTKPIFAAAIENNILSENDRAAEKAFQFMEKSKALGLRKRYQSDLVRNFRDVPPALLQKEYDLKKDIIYYNRTIKSNPSESALYRESTDSLLRREEQYRVLKTIFKNDYPRYFDLQFQNSTVALTDIQGTLHRDEALLDFFTIDDRIIICIILSDAVNFLIVDSVKEEDISAIYQNISQLPTTKAAGANTDKSKGFLHKVWHPLLADLPENISELYIIPDGKLGYLPFEIFPLPDGNLTLEKYKIGYAYSAALRWFQGQENARRPEKFFAGFAPAYPASAENLLEEYALIVERNGELNLPGAAAEVTRIAEKWNGDAFVGKSATADLFRRTAADYQILHLAGHALADDFNPLNSRLLFNDSLGNIQAVSAADLYGMELNADLVVLSACNTGYGQLKKGEGIVSLHHAFTYAGAGAALMSLWAVPDKQTSEIMIAFHDYLHAGKTKTEALRAAKLDYLREAKTEVSKHPYYWAGFVLTGDTGAIEADKGYFLWYGLGVLAVLILVGFLFFRKN